MFLNPGLNDLRTQAGTAAYRVGNLDRIHSADLLVRVQRAGIPRNRPAVLLGFPSPRRVPDLALASRPLAKRQARERSAPHGTANGRNPNTTSPMREERRAAPRGGLQLYWNAIYRILRASATRADSVLAALGIFLVAGLFVAICGVWIFVELAGHVRSGSTQAFDDYIIRWLAAHHSPMLDASMLEITALGTGTVVMMIVAVAS